MELIFISLNSKAIRLVVLVILVEISFYVSFTSFYLQMTVEAVFEVVVKKMIVCKLKFDRRKVIREANVKHDVRGVFDHAT